jgi:hypothetical protein
MLRPAFRVVAGRDEMDRISRSRRWPLFLNANYSSAGPQKERERGIACTGFCLLSDDPMERISKSGCRTEKMNRSNGSHAIPIRIPINPS